MLKSYLVLLVLALILITVAVYGRRWFNRF
jgi:hypothetical protein